MGAVLASRPATHPVAAGGWRQAIRVVLPLWLVVRSAVALLTTAVRWARDGPSLTDRAGARVADPTNGGFLAALFHWDSGYYLSIADHGYFGSGASPALPAFFPGYPLASRAVADLFTAGSSTPGTLVAAMWLVSSIASLAAAIVCWQLMQQLAPSAATLATVMLLAGPYSIFLFADYSESLFVAFAIAAWYCGARQQWWWAGLWCGLATATRINGLFLLVALIVGYLVQRRRSGEPWWNRRLLWVLPAGSGVLGYFSYLAVRTGNPFAWNTAQTQGWHRELHWPWEAFYQTAGRVLFASTLDRRLQFGLDILAAVLIGAALVVWIRRRDWAAATFAGLTLLALTTSFTFVSLARNSVTVFPLTILLATVVISSRRRLRVTVLTAWWGLFAVNATLFALGYWAD